MQYRSDFSDLTAVDRDAPRCPSHPSVLHDGPEEPTSLRSAPPHPPARPSPGRRTKPRRARDRVLLPSPDGTIPSEPTARLGPVVIRLAVRCVRRAAAFYRCVFAAEVIGLHHDRREGARSLLRFAEMTVLLFEGRGAFVGEGVTVQLRLADADRALRRALTLGGRLSARAPLPWEPSVAATLVDPFGHRWSFDRLPPA